MTLKRLLILISCAVAGFAMGRWLSAPPRAPVPGPQIAESRTVPASPPKAFPAAERAGRVPFADLYGALRTARTEEHRAYLRSILQLPEGPDRRAALTAFFQCLASISAQKAADLVPQTGDDDIQRAVLAILGATPASQTAILVKMLLDLPPETDSWRAGKIRGQMFYWAAFDPTAAAQFADQYESTYPGLTASGIIQCIAATDPAAAERWLNQHPDLRKQSTVMSDYIQGLYQNDPAAARQFVTQNANDPAIQPAVKDLARLTFLHSADDALEFITHLPAKEARRAALDGVVDTNIDLFVTAENNRTALRAGLAEWVMKFPEDEWPDFMPRFLEKWRTLDPDGSFNWMANLPSPTRSAIAREVVRDLPPPEVKQLLARTTGDLHRDVVAAVSQRLSKFPEDRQAFIEELGLSPEDAAQLKR